MLFSIVFFTLIFAGIALLIYWILKQFSVGSPASNLRTDALEILKIRYAKGEITKEEFEKIKKDLS